MDLIRVKLVARNSGLHNSGECDPNSSNWTEPNDKIWQFWNGVFETLF